MSPILPAQSNGFLVKLRSPQAATKLAIKTDAEILTDRLVLTQNLDDIAGLEDQVIYTEPNHRFQRFQPIQPNATVSPSQWGLHNEGQNGGKIDADIDAPEAWQTTQGHVLVAVLDTGIDPAHPDFQKTLYRNAKEIPDDGLDNDGNGVIDDVLGYNAALDNGDPTSDDSHGTHCAGIVAANGKVSGVAPQSTILPIRIFDDDDWTDAATLVRAINYAQKAGAKVANHSYGGIAFNQSVKEALEQSQMLHVVAAGNYASNNDAKPNFPASYNLNSCAEISA